MYLGVAFIKKIVSMPVNIFNEFVSTKSDTVPAKTLQTRFLKVYLQRHKDEIKCLTLNIA
jgi:hypothetical protein